ncbi:Txe/YoeB family addiction module toxin [Gordonia pseudamarae]|jgi:toxin YoeB|uniref:Endoribonuclease YoeB n=1 Tax=Gordonia pseudamarae TaxID=2831662 RepID=A0ABX6IDA9_9ACTN|nr:MULTISPECIES: Txe/YoeB family addiction module toxin [Gordonia]MBD0022103.1 Txe/YoeB family addiction module toxin [Gordonia sp. (in: high G+C Gram-positive bacteria)]QHN24954.1 Txe/YoeB family addiction module toxin [Gordonia pseudamarae]QHN33888.1 Txe/YoeB family addiction module toxin [Gordonia pseudamarae]
MRLVFTPRGWEDCTHWQTADRQKLTRINRLITETLREPSGGIGKPEPLRQALTGLWSRRIDDEHRLVYQVDGDDLIILKARYQYE